MKGKQHLKVLPDVKVPLGYPRDSELLSISLPIFESKQGRNALFTDKSEFDIDAFKYMVCKSAVWAYVSIATNTDLCDNGVAVYFHVEDTIAEIAVPILHASGVPDEWIHLTHFDKFPNADSIDEYMVGKKYAYLDDPKIKTDVCMVWDSDAHVYRYPGTDKLKWYDCFQSDLKEFPMFSFHSEWNGYDHLFVNWLLRGVGIPERVFPENDPGRNYDMKLSEEEAYNAVGLELPNQQCRWGGAVLSLPRKHPLFDFLVEHHTRSYADEALLSLYMNAYPTTEFRKLEDKLLPLLLNDSEFLEQKSSTIIHLGGYSPEMIAKYKNRMILGIDGRNKTSQVANIVKPIETQEKFMIQPSKGRLHVISVPHNPSHKDFSTCAFAQKARKDCYMGTISGYETHHYGNELSDVVCTEHITVTTQADLEESYGDFITQSEFYSWGIDQYAYKMFFLRAEHEIRKRFQPKDVICYVFGPGQRPLFNNLQDLENAIHCENGIGYYYPYAPYRVHESPALMHYNLGIAQSRYDQWASLPQENRRNRSESEEIHHAWMQWYEAVIPNSFDLEDFEYSDTHDDYFLCLGRIMPGKGIEIAMRVAHALGKKLVVAGQGDFEEKMGFKAWNNVELVGRADIALRKELLSNCIALFALSTYPEPFGGVHIEANMSGKPVISTDIGAYCRSVKSGLTGYRVRLNVFEQAKWAARNIDKIDPATCRRWGQRFRTEKVAHAYDEYYSSVIASVDNNKSPFWLENDERTNLDWVDDTFEWMNDPIL